MVIERFGDLEVFREMEAELERGVALDVVIALEMATITAPLDEVVAWLLEHVRVRGGFRELVEARDPLIVSAGFRETIDMGTLRFDSTRDDFVPFNIMAIVLEMDLAEAQGSSTSFKVWGTTGRKA